MTAMWTKALMKNRTRHFECLLKSCSFSFPWQVNEEVAMPMDAYFK
jgi:hypothetical protein